MERAEAEPSQAAPRSGATTLARDVVVLGLTWGASVVLQRVAVLELAPIPVVLLRLIAAVLFFLPFAGRIGRAVRGRPRLIADLLIIGGLNPAGTGVLSAAALQFASSGIVAVLISLGPLFTALLARFVLREPPLRPRQWVGLLIAFAGVALLILAGGSGIAGRPDDVRGQLIALAIAAMMAVATIYTRRRLGGVDPLAAAAGQITAGLVLLLPFGLGLAGQWSIAAVSVGGWLAIVASGAIGLSASFILFLGMIERHGPTGSLLALYVAPVAAAILGAAFLGETITLPMAAGGGLVLLGVAAFTRR